MNNQAAQTMPELPGPFDVIEQVDKYNFVHNVEVYTADQMHQYARDYAAALSQTAGVAEGWRTEIESILSDDRAGGPPTDDDGSCVECGRWTPRYHPEAHQHKDGCKAVMGWGRRLNWRERLTAILAAAPAASGGEEASRTLPIDVRGQWYEVPIPVHLYVVSLREKLNNPATFFNDGTALANWLDSLHSTNDDGAATDEKWEPAQRAAAFLRGELTAPNPPAAASVSERARELAEPVMTEQEAGELFKPIRRVMGKLHEEIGWYADEYTTPAEKSIAALEQALTQQRGDGEAVDRDAWAEALELPQGYTVEEFLPGGWHYAWTRADGERMVSGTTWNHPALAAIAAWQYAPATTPQPGAEALLVPRDLVSDARDWVRAYADAFDCPGEDPTMEVCRVARELESLLGRGGK